jgi:thiamine biosynthesis protein ThiS
MNLTINGQRKNFSAPFNVAQLLSQLELNPEQVVVELNRDILTADKYIDIQLQDGDSLEIIQFVGGG